MSAIAIVSRSYLPSVVLHAGERCRGTRSDCNTIFDETVTRKRSHPYSTCTTRARNNSHTPTVEGSRREQRAVKQFANCPVSSENVKTYYTLSCVLHFRKRFGMPVALSISFKRCHVCASCSFLTDEKKKIKVLHLHTYYIE